MVAVAPAVTDEIGAVPMIAVIPPPPPPPPAAHAGGCVGPLGQPNPWPAAHGPIASHPTTPGPPLYGTANLVISCASAAVVDSNNAARPSLRTILCTTLVDSVIRLLAIAEEAGDSGRSGT